MNWKGKLVAGSLILAAIVLGGGLFTVTYLSLSALINAEQQAAADLAGETTPCPKHCQCECPGEAE